MLQKRQVKIFLIYLLLLLKNDCFAQYYRFDYHTSDDNIVFDTKELGNGEIFTCGISENYTQKKRDGLVQHFNASLQLLDSSVITLQGKYISFQRIVGLNQIGELILLGALSDTASLTFGYVPAVFKLDSNLNLISYKTYQLANNRPIVTLGTSRTSDGFVFYYGEYLDSSLVRHFIYKINSSGDSISSAVIYGYPALTIHDCLYNPPTNDYYYFTTGSNFLPELCQIMCVDSMLNFKYWTYISPGSTQAFFDRQYSVKNFNNTAYLYSGTFSSFNSTTSNIFVAKVNRNTNTHLHYNQFGQTNNEDIPADLSSLDFINKNSIYLGGNNNFFQHYTSPHSYILINQIDSNLNLKWQRIIGGDAEYSLQTVLATTDGGCILNATKYDTLNNNILYQHDIVIIKLDSLGTVTGTSDGSKIKVSKYMLYPNPAQNLVTISGYIEHSILIELYDAMGKCALSKKINTYSNRIDIENLHAGMYYYKITDGTYSESGKWMKE